MSWTIREASVADLHHIMQIETAIFVTDAWSPEMMRSELESPHTYYLVATPVGAPEIVQGYAGMKLPRGAVEADIQNIAVDPSARRMGLGGALMHALLAEARARSAREVFLEVRVDNDAARDLYLGLGFVDIGIRPHYYQPDDVDAISMKLELAPRPLPVGGEAL